MSSQFDARGEEAAGVLTFGGVEAGRLRRAKRLKSKSQNQTGTFLVLLQFVTTLSSVWKSCLWLIQ